MKFPGLSLASPSSASSISLSVYAI
jgi:hypothetical protein